MRVLLHPAEHEIRLENLFHALSDPARLEVVRTLIALGSEQSCNSLGEAMAKSTFSHHLKVLRESGVTRTRVAGTHRYVTVRSEELNRRFPGLLDLVERSGPPALTDAAAAALSAARA
ncbi:helix-turn-helix transcriptional regulator [Dactylosporangium sp. NPDC000555]|uniref:ArsR/SmtB family transcription factor n=1 Tax=Dactylosporangium sp. NPDC000555 TaxID=3154260 RepID=UPI00332C5A7A